MSINKEAVAELVAYGIPSSQIGDAFGVTPQYIANLIRDDEKVKELVQKKATDIAVRQHNNKVSEETIEADLLEKIKAQIDMSDSLIESVKCLQLMKQIQALTRSSGHGQAAEVPGTINLNLGDAPVDVRIQRTGNNEIIEIAGRSMAAMPAKQVLQTVKQRKENATAKNPNEPRAAERNVRNAPAEPEYEYACTDSL
jgi:hypothetical protein